METSTCGRSHASARRAATSPSGARPAPLAAAATAPAALTSAAKAFVTLIVLALSVALVSLAAGCSLGGESQLPGIGERASNEKIAVTVHSVKFYDEITSDVGNAITPNSKGDVFIIADLTIANAQDSPVRISPENVRLVRDDGDYAKGASATSTTFLPWEFKALKAQSLAAGKKVRGMVAWVLAKDTILDKLVVVADPDLEIGLNGMAAHAPAAKKPPRLGQTAKGGGLALTVRSVTYPAKLTHGLWTTSAKSGSKMVLIDLSVKNLTRRPSFTVNPINVIVVDTKGKQHISSMMVLGLADSAEFKLTKLKPGATEGGKVVISVKKNLKVKRIRYAVGVLGAPLEIAVSR